MTYTFLSEKSLLKDMSCGQKYNGPVVQNTKNHEERIGHYGDAGERVVKQSAV